MPFTPDLLKPRGAKSPGFSASWKTSNSPAGSEDQLEPAETSRKGGQAHTRTHVAHSSLWVLPGPLLGSGGWPDALGSFGTHIYKIILEPVMGMISYYRVTWEWSIRMYWCTDLGWLSSQTRAQFLTPGFWSHCYIGACTCLPSPIMLCLWSGF